MAAPSAKRLKMAATNGSNGHGYGFDVGVDYNESSVSIKTDFFS